MDRPFVTINVAATADGKIDTFERPGAAISSAHDKERVDQLRAEADAVMVGGHTLHDEDPKLTVKSESFTRTPRTRTFRQIPPKWESLPACISNPIRIFSMLAPPSLFIHYRANR